MELENSKVFHEPFEQAFYLGPERQSERYKHQSPDDKRTYHNIGHSLIKEYEGVDLVFSKDMGYAVYNHFDEFLQGGFQAFKHTFLIRNPSKSIPSLYAASINKQLTGWDYFDPEEGGFKQLLELYWFIVANIDENPIVVDADDLLEDPEGIMRAYCEGIGVKFDKKMLEWEPRHLPRVHAYRGWHTNVLNSSGFCRQVCSKPEMNGKKKVENETLPEIVLQTIEDSMPCYEELYKKRIRPVKAAEKQ